MSPDLLARIESPELSAEVNVVSGYDQFLRALASLPEVGELREQARTADGAARLLQRALGLLRTSAEPSCESPYDVALAAYLFVLSEVDPDGARMAALLVRECPTCWWAR